MGEFMNDPKFEFLRDFDENIHKTCCEIDLLIYNKFYNASLNASRRAVENLLRNVYGIKKDVDFNFILRNYERKIDDSIYKNLYKSDLVIVDITGLNPNVFLELGYRMSLNHHLNNSPLIIIKDECDKSKIPFDIVTHPVNQYTFDVEGSDDFKIKLKSIINAIDFKQKRVTLVNAKGERLFIKD